MRPLGFSLINQSSFCTFFEMSMRSMLDDTGGTSQIIRAQKEDKGHLLIVDDTSAVGSLELLEENRNFATIGGLPSVKQEGLLRRHVAG